MPKTTEHAFFMSNMKSFTVTNVDNLTLSYLKDNSGCQKLLQNYLHLDEKYTVGLSTIKIISKKSSVDILSRLTTFFSRMKKFLKSQRFTVGIWEGLDLLYNYQGKIKDILKYKECTKVMMQGKMTFEEINKIIKPKNNDHIRYMESETVNNETKVLIGFQHKIEAEKFLKQMDVDLIPMNKEKLEKQAIRHQSVHVSIYLEQLMG